MVLVEAVYNSTQASEIQTLVANAPSSGQFFWPYLPQIQALLVRNGSTSMNFTFDIFDVNTSPGANTYQTHCSIGISNSTYSAALATGLGDWGFGSPNGTMDSAGISSSGSLENWDIAWPNGTNLLLCANKMVAVSITENPGGSFNLSIQHM